MPERRRYHPVDFGERQWSQLLAFALDRADMFECAIPYAFVAQSLAGAPLWPRHLNAFRDDVVDRHVSYVRWDVSLDFPTQFVRFRLTQPLRGYIRGVGALDRWLWEHGTPEDPTFCSGEEPILAGDSMEGRIAVYADDSDFALLATTGVKLVEPLGVQAEPWPTP